MAFFDEVHALSRKFAERTEYLKSEEATKHALVLPFIDMLGYDTHNPTEVRPEYVADVGMKRDEKVDYALIQDGNPVILIECKSFGTNLNEKAVIQLWRYFLTTEVSFGVLTDGTLYRFFTNLNGTAKMDEEPFFEINMLDPTETQVQVLERFSKANFNDETNVSFARDLKYTKSIKDMLAQEFERPTDDFVHFIMGRFYKGRATQDAREQFRAHVRRAFSQFVHEQSPFAQEVRPKQMAPPQDAPPQKKPVIASPEPTALHSSGWQSLATLKPVAVNGVSPKPVEIRFPDESHRPIKSWSHVMVEVTGWLMRKNFLHADSLPIRRNSRYLVAKNPTHPSGKPFKNPQLAGNVFSEGNYSAHDHTENARIVIKHVGQDPAKFAVRFD